MSPTKASYLVPGDRISFSELMPVNDLRPVRTLRARLFASGQPVTTLTRAFEARAAARPCGC
jgi:hypothetical protein